MDSPKQKDQPARAPDGVRTTTTSLISLPPISHAVPSIRDPGIGAANHTRRPRLPPLPAIRSKVEQHLGEDTIIKLDGKKLKEYHIEGLIYTMQEGINETHSYAERRTKDGRRISYKLTVLQQPTRARACGSGPRSSADRRPVDPPPVVQLHVFHGEKGLERDCTMTYEATFVLYASLELARPIAGARMYNQTIVPVLTGVPVAGTAYLDKPNPAAYFIFPDLSVRHEGWYNLRFCLFEGIKNWTDADVSHPYLYSDPNGRPATEGKPNPWESMINRMEVRSEKFQVFSAKKFPGLKGSTGLSRLIADQGCRVRIRREVRQRKRPTKDEGSDDEGDKHSELRATPEAGYQVSTPSDRARSMSRNSMDAGAYQPPEAYRRYSSESQYGPNTLPPMRSPQASQPAYPSMPPPAQVVSTYNMPPPTSLLNQRNPEPRPYMSSYPTMPNPRAQPSGPIASEDNYNTLPPLSTLSNYDPNRRLYNLPETGPAQKRSYSPHSSYDQSTPLKAGARPDTLPAPQPLSALAPLSQFGNGWSQGVMEADSDDDEIEEDSDENSLMEGAYTYKRADGSRGNKVSVHLTSHNRR